ncbi:hypothetical protein CRG98_013803 [Punica granatum]|uniref:Integrase catalytic domain-containing protein n=1 Tax=Punica granatum TaxID=22663 RepID=A0A2I0KBA4_PUNGR|nr:hypothetical protein CRG98_013803 [Punica granatum]
MIDFLTRYHEVFVWFYADMPGLNPSIVKYFLSLDTEKFSPKRQQLRRQRASLLLRIKEEVVKQINADKCQPLFRLLRKNAAIEWDEECQKAFDTIKAYLVQPLVLVPPTPGRPLILYLTVRQQSLRCMLGQEEESTHTEHAIYYLSKKFIDGEFNYSKIEKMCCALVWVMQRLRQYMLYHTIRLLSKANPLKYLLDSLSSMWNIAKWRCQLTEYDIEYVSRTSVKGQAIADHLAEFPIEDNTPIDPNFQDEGILQVDDEGEKPEWKMYFDGAACILGLQAAIDFKAKELEVFGDSMLTIFQTLGQWKTKDAKLVPYHKYLERLTANFEDSSFTYTPRMNNQFADVLATLASMVSITKENLIEPLEIEITKGPAHCNAIEASEAKPWYEDIKKFLRTGQCPPFADHRDRKTLRCLAIHYFLSDEILYRCSFDSTLLRCINEHESRRLMEEAITLASVTAKAVAHILRRDVIARYGVPATIITDNAKNLNNKVINELCAQFKIRHRNSTPYRPQMNGAVEAANKNIKKIIEKMTVNYKDWYEMLPYALLAYRTSIRTSTGATPYSLVYGMEVVFPIEVEIPSMRILAETELEEAEWAKQRYEQLNFIDEKRLKALCHGQCYQQRMARAFNARVRHCEFNPGDLVLRKVLHVTLDSRGKFSYKYDGPFVVKETFSGGAVILSDMDGTENALPTPITLFTTKPSREKRRITLPLGRKPLRGGLGKS